MKKIQLFQFIFSIQLSLQEEYNLKQFEVRMSQQLQQVCDNCQRPFPQSKIATHFGYCRRNIKKCQKCGEMYDINFTEEHEEQFHKMSSCKYCNKSIKPNQLSKHQGQCESRTQYCEYCDLDVPARQYAGHLRECESRTKQCQKCRRAVSNKDFLIHTISCAGMIEEQKPNISSGANKYGNYQNLMKYQQRREEIKKNQYKPSYQQPRQQPSKGGAQRGGQRERQRERKPQLYPQTNTYTNNPLKGMQMKKELSGPTKPSSQSKPTVYADINMNKNLSQGDRRAPNISEKDKYGRIQPSKNIDSGKNIGPSKVPDMKYIPSSRTGGTQYQPPQQTTNTHGIRKPSSDVPMKVNPPTGLSTKVYQPTVKETSSRPIQPSINYPKVPQTYKRQIPSSKEVYVRRQTEKPKQVQPKREVNYPEYKGNYQPQSDVYNFKKQDQKTYQEPTRSRPQPQTYVSSGQQRRPSEQPRSQVPPQNTYTGTGSGDHDEDEQLQKAIMASLGNVKISSKTSQSSQQPKSKQTYKMDDIPPQFLENDMMNESFYGKQIALMEEIQRNKKKR